jgi:hypothetical protein
MRLQAASASSSAASGVAWPAATLPNIVFSTHVL